MSRFNRTIRGDVVINATGAAIAVGLSAYTAHDVVGGLLKCVYGTGGGALLRSIKVLDKANQSEPYIIHIYRSQPSAIADDAAFAPTDADGQKEIGQITVLAGDYATANGSAYSAAFLRGALVDIDVPETCAGTIYIYLQCTDTPDYVAADDLEIEMFFWIE
jgi:hypothetical protein